MPCNLPIVNVSANLLTKITLSDTQALMYALSVVEQADKNFTFEKTAEGIKVRNHMGEVLLVWQDNEWKINAANQMRAKAVMSKVFSNYQASVIQMAMMQEGYTTDRVQAENNQVKLYVGRD